MLTVAGALPLASVNWGISIELQGNRISFHSIRKPEDLCLPSSGKLKAVFPDLLAASGVVE